MTKVYDSIDYYIDDLLSYLFFYKEIISQNLFDQYYKEKAEELLQNILSLENIANEKGDLTTYDFNGLKKELATIFHPDRFKIQLEHVENPEEIFGKTLGIIQDISDIVNDSKSKQTTFKYNTATDECYCNPNGYSSSNKSSSNEYYYETDANTFFQYVSERFHAFFYGIPSNSDDYDKILIRLEKSIKNLNIKMQTLKQNISFLERENEKNKIEWINGTRDEFIEHLYQEELNSLYIDYMKKKREHQISLSACDKRYNELLPQINYEMQKWQTSANKYISYYNQLINDYATAMRSFDFQNADELRQEIDKMRNLISQHYSDRNSAYRNIKTEILRNDPEFNKLNNAFVRTNKNLDLAEKKFNEFKSNKSQQKEKIKKRLDNQYREKAQKYESSLIKMYSKKSATSRKYTQATKKREELIRDYGPIFGNQYQK